VTEVHAYTTDMCARIITTSTSAKPTSARGQYASMTFNGCTSPHVVFAQIMVNTDCILKNNFIGKCNNGKCECDEGYITEVF
jgi:hypothetical protein